MFLVLTSTEQLPTALASLAALRQRGAQFNGLGFRGSDLAGATGASSSGVLSSASDSACLQCGLCQAASHQAETVKATKLLKNLPLPRLPVPILPQLRLLQPLSMLPAHTNPCKQPMLCHTFLWLWKSEVALQLNLCDRYSPHRDA